MRRKKRTRESETGAPDNGERPAKPGPEPERLKLPHEDWEEAVREAMEKEKPEGDEKGGRVDDDGVEKDGQTKRTQPESWALFRRPEPPR